MGIRRLSPVSPLCVPPNVVLRAITLVSAVKAGWPLQTLEWYAVLAALAQLKKVPLNLLPSILGPNFVALR